MTLSSRHFAAVKMPLFVLAAVVLGSAGAISWTRTQIADAERALATQQSQLREAQNRFQRSGDERDLIVRYKPLYEALRETGLIGPEQRINWLDALRTTNQETRLFGAEYQITTQQPYPHAQELNAPRLGMAQSLMKINLRLTHEGELLRFFRRLEAQRAGAFDINECLLERSASADAPLAAQPNLRAECELAWITINPEPQERRP
jgi:hypothetical protein